MAISKRKRKREEKSRPEVGRLLCLKDIKQNLSPYLEMV